jgi:hypothetical protein
MQSRAGFHNWSDGRTLYRGVFRSVDELRKVIKQFIAVHNDTLAKPFRWTKSAEATLGSVEHAKRSLLANGLTH